MIGLVRVEGEVQSRTAGRRANLAQGTKEFIKGMVVTLVKVWGKRQRLETSKPNCSKVTLHVLAGLARWNVPTYPGTLG